MNAPRRENEPASNSTMHTWEAIGHVVQSRGNIRKTGAFSA